MALFFKLLNGYACKDEQARNDIEALKTKVNGHDSFIGATKKLKAGRDHYEEGQEITFERNGLAVVYSGKTGASIQLDGMDMGYILSGTLNDVIIETSAHFPVDKGQTLRVDGLNGSFDGSNRTFTFYPYELKM